MMPIRKVVLTATFLLGTALEVAAQPWQPMPERPPVPKDNPSTEAKVELGKMLYFDPRLSSTGTVSCNSCHDVMRGGDDARPTSMGVDGQIGPRNAPTVWNAAFLSVQFWDGRADTLEDQAKGPMTNPKEMGMPTHTAVIERIEKIPGYRAKFEEAFGKGEGVNIENAVKAIAAYERTLITPDTPFNLYLKGDKSALSETQVQGMKKFMETGCTTCHSGPVLAGPEMQLGQGFFMPFPTFKDNPDVAKYKLMEDTGRFSVTHNDTDKHLWRVPTLYNVALTAPYFHTGLVNSLDEAVRVMARTQLNRDLTAEDSRAIATFLGSLSATRFPAQTLPRLPLAPGESVIVEHGETN